MTRFFGKIGYEDTGSLVKGVWTASIVERDYYGDLLNAARSSEPSAQVNDNYGLQNQLSVLADAFALENFANIKYVLWNEVRWTVTTVTIQRPRLILSFGGVYDGPIPA